MHGRIKRVAGCLLLAAVSPGLLAQPVPERGGLQLDSLPGARFQFTGLAGGRVSDNVGQWLLVAPQANPGMLEMFRVRDRRPLPQLVPWAGEFVGKYLISAVQALRLTEDSRLSLQVSNVVAAFIATQADDGYLGPFPQDVRLLKHWDLWGHHHAIQALLLWHEHSGDPAALVAARRAGDLVCRTYLDTGRRVFDAGDHEMNMAILTGLAMLHRLTGEPRYLRMAREVERDWERAGDYLRAGLDGREFYQSPRPRWESLHGLQGLLELWRLTGEAKYREAFIHHWRSIRRWDRRNTGGFSSGEQATGNPYAPTAIETCCTVAWMALTVDYLRLTGDSLAADELELSTLNGGLGAQHPSGRWWTYSTPMDGERRASAHDIVFQARAGTPELNCCSVNGPRALGMLGEWAVMQSPDGLTLNALLPGTFTLPLRGGAVRLTLNRDYPREDVQRVVIAAAPGEEWTLRLRIPAWSRRTRVQAGFSGAPTNAPASSYLEIRRRWQAGDEVTLHFDFAPRAVPGAREAAGRVSLYRGPLLLAYDQAANPFDEDAIPAVDLARLGESKVSWPEATDTDSLSPRPWLTVEVPARDGPPLRLVDFASAGAGGTRYRSWLPAAPMPAAPAFTQHPRDGERVRPDAVEFRWRGPRGASSRVEVADDPGFGSLLLQTNVAAASRLALAFPFPAGGRPRPLCWRVVSIGETGEVLPDVPVASFVLDPAAPPQVLPPALRPGPQGELVRVDFRNGRPPAFGEPPTARGAQVTPEGAVLRGAHAKLVFPLAAWPEEDFSVVVRARVDELPAGRLGQVFSAWAAGSDDPLRLVVDGGRLFARIEAGAGFTTAGVPVTPGAWLRLAAVKRGPGLVLWVDGREAGRCPAPEFSTSAARSCALGGNPNYAGHESLAATFSDFALFARALTPEEVAAWAAE